MSLLMVNFIVIPSARHYCWFIS